MSPVGAAQKAMLATSGFDLITDGLVSRWTFEDDSDTSTLTDTEGPNDGSVSGMSFVGNSSPEGSLNGSYDGTDDNVTVSDDASLNFGTNDFAIAFWIYKDSTVNDRGNVLWDEVPIYKKEAGGTGYLLYFDEVNSGVLSWGIEGTSIDSTSDINDGNWYAVVAQRDGGTIELHIDGSEENSTSASTADASSSKALKFGERSSNNDRNYEGDLDDIRIYNRALTDTEIQTFADGDG